MSDWHGFNVDVACEVGVNAAILLGNIKHWCDKNKANGKHCHDGLWWTYNSIKALQEIYPYLGRSAINSALKKLEERGYIKTGNFNKSAYDRTIWYAITDDGRSLFGDSIYRKSEMEEQKNENGNTENEEPIPNIDQLSDSSQPDIPQEADKPPIDEIMAYFNERTGKHFSPTAKNTVKEVTGRWGDYPEKTREERISMFKTVIDNMCVRWIGTTQEQWLVPSTIFRASHFDDYLNATPTPPKQSQNNHRSEDFSAYAQPKVGDKRIANGETQVYQQDGTWKVQEPTIFDMGDEDIDF